MRFSSNNVVTLILSGVMTTTALARAPHPVIAQVKNSANIQLTTDQAKQTKSDELTSTEKLPASSSGELSAPPTAPGPEAPSPKETSTKVKRTAIEPIEPFIKADVVALGQWLMTKTVKTLVAGPVSTQVASASPNQPDSKAPKPTEKTEKEPDTPAKAAQTQTPQSPTPLPKVNLQALPPEPSDSPTIDGHTEMRVALTKKAPSVAIAASAGGAIISTNGELIENLPASIGYRVTADARGLFLNGEPIPTTVWLEPDNGYVAVGERWYRGRLLLLWQNGGVMAVNHVLLRDYLPSVVGAEMSASWSLEALKAQAVAARSYAIVHTVRHQRRAYDLDDTQRYQAYKGIATEASSTHQAVHETAGEFISYDGGIVESLYAANQDIVDDAHSGYGMSQTGALDLAEQGYQYYEILSAYYPDTSVGRIDIGN
ncbi:MAG: SpoIID/LytB domain-containing protein [Cyanobacteria bacterium P01_D01_bin.56]